MLDDRAIDKLIQPLIDRQEFINSYVLRQIAERIKKIGEMSTTDAFRLRQLFLSGSNVQEINKELARLAGLQIAEIQNIIHQVAEDSYIDVKPFYDYRELPFVPLEKNERLQKLITAISEQTAGTYRNISNSKAIGFLSYPTSVSRRPVFGTIDKVYKDTIDQAIQATQTAGIDYGTAMRRTMKQLVDSGIRRLVWESGYTQRLDTAVKRNILDGIRQVNQGVQKETGKQFKADGIELTAHLNPAPDHAPVQGHQFTNEEFEKMQNGEDCKDIHGNVYAGFDRKIGELNCKHLAYSIVIAHAKPVYTDAQLKQILESNDKGYTTPSGKHFTGYECLQHQNVLALKVRKAKDGQIMARTAGDMELAKFYQAQINNFTAQYKAFNSASGLNMRMDKLTVMGYHRISV